MKISYESTRLINEVLEDIFLFGLNVNCYKYISKKDGFIKDYLLKKDNENEVLFIDEDSVETTLFFLLSELISQDCILEISDLASRLIGARDIAGLTQQELAEKVGIKQQNIAQYERDQRKPKLERLQEVARACNVPVNLFLE